MMREWFREKLEETYGTYEPPAAERGTARRPESEEWIAAELEREAGIDVHPSVAELLELDDEDLEEIGTDTVGYADWATGAAPAEWYAAAAEAGTPDLPQPTVYDLPPDLRTAVEQRRLDARVAAARARDRR